jgi:hypothetical protein
MKIKHFLTPVLCLGLLAGCGGFYNISMGRRADGSTRVSVGFAEDEAGNLIHRRSGTVFPPEVAGFARDSVYIYDSHGGDVSVRYNLSDPWECFLDVYVYPAYGELEKHAAETKTTIEAYHENARLISEAPISHEHGGTNYTGAGFTFRYRAKLKGGEQPVESRTWLFMYKEWFLQYRITYPESAVAEIEGSLAAFLDELLWP